MKLLAADTSGELPAHCRKLITGMKANHGWIKYRLPAGDVRGVGETGVEELQDRGAAPASGPEEGDILENKYIECKYIWK